MSEPSRSRPTKKFGTLAGVFVPTLLTILGVIMYLRLGWVVGNAGLVGGMAIILLACGITLATGLSLASISTNTQLEAGGPYAIISKSLGQEVGGAIGVPLYLSQALAVAMYIFGFREGWVAIFPGHPAILVDFGVFLVMFGIAFVSTSLAFRIQYVVLAVILGSLVVVLASPVGWAGLGEVTLFGDYSGTSAGTASRGFWIVFAVFFPAATGIMAGANMSGELENPRVNIPVGTISAIVLSMVVYMVLAVWVAGAATTEELIDNYTIMVDRSLFGPLVLAGLLGATFSSALSSLVGAPRILAALGTGGVVPAGRWIAESAVNGEPRRGMIITGAIVACALLLRDLNVVAPLITMFFLITYTVINGVMMVEGSLGLLSFRPTLHLPRWVPLLGAVGCGFAMFIVNPTFSLISVGVVGAIYFYLLKRGVVGAREDVRSGIFVAFAEWAAARVTEYGMANFRAWKPNVLVPVQDPAALRGEFHLLLDVCRPEGSLKILGLATTETAAEMTPRIENQGRAFRHADLFTTWSIVDTADFSTGICAGLQALGSAFFRPNVVFLRLPEEPERYDELEHVIGEARRLGVGVMLWAPHHKAGLGHGQVVNLWIRPEDPARDMAESLARNNANLAILTAYRLCRAWNAELNIISVVATKAEVPAAHEYLAALREVCRLPRNATSHVLVDAFEAAVASAPQSDIDIIGLRAGAELELARELVERTRSACLFTSDSGKESAHA